MNNIEEAIKKLSGKDQFDAIRKPLAKPGCTMKDSDERESVKRGDRKRKHKKNYLKDLD